MTSSFPASQASCRVSFSPSLFKRQSRSNSLHTYFPDLRLEGQNLSSQWWSIWAATTGTLEDKQEQSSNDVDELIGSHPRYVNPLERWYKAFSRPSTRPSNTYLLTYVHSAKKLKKALPKTLPRYYLRSRMVHAPLIVKPAVPLADQEAQADLFAHSLLSSGSDTEFEDHINPSSSPVYRVLSSSQIPTDKQLMDIMDHNNAILAELSASISQLRKQTIEPKVRSFLQNDTNQSSVAILVKPHEKSDMQELK